MSWTHAKKHIALDGDDDEAAAAGDAGGADDDAENRLYADEDSCGGGSGAAAPDDDDGGGDDGHVVVVRGGGSGARSLSTTDNASYHFINLVATICLVVAVRGRRHGPHAAAHHGVQLRVPLQCRPIM